MKTIKLPTKVHSGKWHLDGAPNCFEGWLDYFQFAENPSKEDTRRVNNIIRGLGELDESNKLIILCTTRSELHDKLADKLRKAFGNSCIYDYNDCVGRSVLISSFLAKVYKLVMPEFIRTARLEWSSSKEEYLVWREADYQDKDSMFCYGARAAELRSIFWHRLLVHLGYKVELFDLACDKPAAPLLLTYQPQPIKTDRKEAVYEPARVSLAATKELTAVS